MSEYSASYEQEGEEEDVHEIEIEDAVKELKVMFPDVDDDIILNALMVNSKFQLPTEECLTILDMSLEETIDDLIKRTKKMKVYNPEEASKQSSKVYDELDEDQEEMINKTRSEFFGTSIHRVNLLRDRQKEERKKLQYKISEDEISDKIWKARLKYACTMPPPEYKFSQKVDFQSSNNILADYFQIGITGHDVSSPISLDNF
jgi:hypothetical protein